MPTTPIEPHEKAMQDFDELAELIFHAGSWPGSWEKTRASDHPADRDWFRGIAIRLIDAGWRKS